MATLFSLRRLTTLIALSMLLSTPCLSEDVSSDSKRRFRDVLSLLRIPAGSLPKGVRLIDEIVTAPILAADENPGVLVEREKLQFLGLLVGLRKPETAKVCAGFVAVYFEGDPQNEIGVYALQFNSEDETLRIFERLTENPGSRILVRKGNLLIHVWKDTGASETAVNHVREYFESAEFPSE